ncbi:hypothetical protein C1X05_14600 [Laceyella sacchari]|nr:hypothetical protein C1X05_14600 [Laceyella sacchari]
MIYSCKKHLLQAVKQYLVPHVNQMNKKTRPCFMCKSRADYTVYIFSIHKKHTKRGQAETLFDHGAKQLKKDVSFMRRE